MRAAATRGYAFGVTHRIGNQLHRHSAVQRLNALATNAVKHAFDGVEVRRFTVTFSEARGVTVRRVTCCFMAKWCKLGASKNGSMATPLVWPVLFDSFHSVNRARDWRRW